MGGPDISGFSELVYPIDVGGPQRFVYSYIALAGDVVRAFLEELKEKRKGRFAHYQAGFRMLGMHGRGPWAKWHMLDPEKPPKGIAKRGGVPLPMKGIGVFKNVPDQSRIYHCTEPGGLIVLLTVYEGKKEDELTADALNPALWMREEYMQRKAELLARTRRIL